MKAAKSRKPDHAPAPTVQMAYDVIRAERARLAQQRAYIDGYVAALNRCHEKLLELQREAAANAQRGAGHQGEGEG